MTRIPHISDKTQNNSNIWGGSHTNERANELLKEPERFLVIDPDQKKRDIICSKLRANGYSVTECSSMEEFLNILKDKKFDIALADAATYDYPYDKLIKNADYYVVRPYTLEELFNRIDEENHLLNTKTQYGDITVNQLTRQVTRNGRTEDLSAKEFRLLEYLAQHQGEVLSRQQLLRDVWDKNFDTNTNVVNVYMRYLRSKIGDPYPGKIIQTVAGEGYRFAPTKDS